MKHISTIGRLMLLAVGLALPAQAGTCLWWGTNTDATANSYWANTNWGTGGGSTWPTNNATATIAFAGVPFPAGGYRTINMDLSLAKSTVYQSTDNGWTFYSGSPAFVFTNNYPTYPISGGNILMNNSLSLQAFYCPVSGWATMYTRGGGGDLKFAGTLTNANGSRTFAGQGVVTLITTNQDSSASTWNITGGTLVYAAGLGATNNAANGLSFGGSATFEYDNTGAGGPLAQSFGALSTPAGEALVQLNRSAAQSVSVTFASLATRLNGTARNFAVTGTPGVIGTDSRVVLTSHATAGTFIDQGTFFGTNLSSAYAVYDSGGFLRGMNYGSDSSSASMAATNTTFTAAGVSGKHVDLGAAGTITAAATESINSLRIGANGANAVTVGASNVLTLANGAVLKTGGNATTISGGLGAGIQAASNVELVIRVDNAADSLAISAPILANGLNALTKSGAGTLILSGPNTYTGSNYLNNGVTSITANNNLGSQSVAAPVYLNHATLQAAATLSLDDGLGDIRPVYLTNACAIDVTPGNNLTLNGTVNGGVTVTGNTVGNSGSLAKTGSGTLTLNAVEPYAGALYVNGGSLVLGAAGSVSNCWLVSVAAGATMDVSASTPFQFTRANGVTFTSAGQPAYVIGAGSGFIDFTNYSGQTANQTFTLNYDGSNPALVCKQGQLDFTAALTVTVNTPNPLAPGTYLIMSNAVGNIEYTSFTAIGTAGIKAVTVTNGGVWLQITNTARTATTTTLSGADTEYTGTNSVMTVTVASSGATGSVQFYTNGVAYGSPVTPNGSGQAVIPATVALAAGTYTVTATYSGTGTLAPSATTAPALLTVLPGTPGSAKFILSFTFPSFGAATIAGTNITITVPYGLAVTSLAPTMTISPYATVSPVSGSTNNFTSPVVYTVTAQDASTQAYQVTVNFAAPTTNRNILSFTLPGLGNAMIAGTNITFTAPAGTGLTNLAPVVTVSPNATVSPVSGATNNFTTPQIYTVTAQNGATKTYLVTVQTYAAWSYSGGIYLLTTTNGASLPASALETNFPVLVRLNGTFFNFSQAGAQGNDLRFSTPKGVSLPYQIEQWDPTNQLASIWVLVPAITGNTNQEIMIYWGNAGAISESSGPAVFNATNGFVSVFHMSETPLVDETGLLSPVDSGTTVAPGMVGNGRHFTAGSGINCGQSITAFPSGAGPFTTEAWFRANAVHTTILGWGNAAANNGYQVELDFASTSSPYVYPSIYLNGYFHNQGGTTLLAEAQWYQVVHTAAVNSSLLYLNGQLDSSLNQTFGIPNLVQMGIGGWPGSFNFVGDIDEVRISNVARSTNWISLEYQSQSMMQTLTGPVVQPGTNFSASPAAVTMNEGAVTNLTGQAGGAQKVYWIYKQNGRQTVLAVDQFTLGISAARALTNQSFVIEFKAVYPSGAILTNDIPVTILSTVPNPVFTLTATTNQWDGRQTNTVTASISNWSALQAAGVTNLNYNWNVSGLAVIDQINAGTVTLLRSQGTGPLTVTLALDNGGPAVSNSLTIAVQEPATNPWAVWTPGPAEKPVNSQFYARDNTGYGTIFYNGTLTNAADSVVCNVYSNGVLYASQSQVPSGGNYAFSTRVMAGLINYSVQFATVTAGVTNIVDTKTNLACGDAYVIEGQSNADASSEVLQADIAYTYSTNDMANATNWIRTYHTNWETAVSWNGVNSAGAIGYWGMDIATNLFKTYNMPICIINAAVGGTRIDQHQPDPANHYDTTNSTYSIYGNLVTRVANARLLYGIRGLIWHQGEQDQGAEGPTGDLDWKSYQSYFISMSGAWKLDFPNLLHYYIFQTMPGACGSIIGQSDNMLREEQRRLPGLYSNMRITSAIGVVPGSNCHYIPLGYLQIASLMCPLVEQDNYGATFAGDITAPNLTQAYYTTPAQNEIALVFGQSMVWNTNALANLFLDGLSNKITSATAAGNVIKLELTAPSTAQTVSYLISEFWNNSVPNQQTNLLWGSNGIPALTFYQVPIAPASVAGPVILNVSPASGRTNGGTVVTLTGSNFLSGATVQFGGSNAAAVTVSNATLMTATTPAHAPGLVNVTVVNTNGLAATNQFTFVPPPPPALLLNASWSATNLTAVWAGGTNQSCVLLAATNLTEPWPSWIPVMTNPVGANGLSTNILLLDPNQPQGYYLLSIPYN